MSRQLTREEVQRRFVEHIKFRFEWWLCEDRAAGTREKMDGLVNDILTVLDGNGDFPGCILEPLSEPWGVQYYLGNGQEFLPDECDIAGELQEFWCELTKREGTS